MKQEKQTNWVIGLEKNIFKILTNKLYQLQQRDLPLSCVIVITIIILFILLFLLALHIFSPTHLPPLFLFLVSLRKWKLNLTRSRVDLRFSKSKAMMFSFRARVSFGVGP